MPVSQIYRELQLYVMIRISKVRYFSVNQFKYKPSGPNKMCIGNG